MATISFGAIFLVAKNSSIYPREIFYLNAFDQDYDGIPPFDDAYHNGAMADRRWNCVLREAKGAQ